MATRFNPRWLRKGRVAYDGEGVMALLLESTAPGTWWVATEKGTRAMRSNILASTYGRLLTGVGSVPNTEKNTEVLKLFASTLEGGTYDALGRRIKMMVAARDKGYSAGVTTGIKDAAAAAAPATRVKEKFEVKPYDADSYFYESEDDSQLYDDFINMRQNSHPVNLLIAGPSGSGKTEGIIRKGKALGIPVHIVNCQAITTPEKWIGQMQANTVDGTYFEPSQHIQWVERTHEDCEGFDYCIILYDEITRLRAELNNMTYSLFDTQRGLEVPQMGRRVSMDSKNMVVATANIGAPFTGTHTQDRAFRERFSLTMERTFPPKAEEVKVLMSAFELDKASAEAIVGVADRTRAMWVREEIDSPISTRTLKAWALLVSGGYSIKKAAEYTVIPLYSNDGGTASERTKVAGLIEGKIV